jgi:dual specificity tyrosine-phosphorylation-regulated kinase 2/3/4
MSRIRDYAIQILDALIFLEQYCIIHCDLKPENILLVDESALTVKLVDYGSGCFRSEQVYTYVQSRFYRAPEVILRINYTEKVDIWSFGCILAELSTGEPLFPGNNEQEQLEYIMEVCGIPPKAMIEKSRKKEHYFDTDFSPFLIEDEELGILRIPENRKLEHAIHCNEPLFLDFLSVYFFFYLLPFRNAWR